MPFKSQSQRRWMFANDPAMAKQWAADTPKGAKLPERAKKPAKHEHGRLIGASKDR